MYVEIVTSVHVLSSQIFLSYDRNLLAQSRTAITITLVGKIFVN